MTQQQVCGNPSSWPEPTHNEDVESCVRQRLTFKPSMADPKITLYVTRKNRYKVITVTDIKNLMKAYDKDIQNIAVYQSRNKYYGKVVFNNRETAKAALAAMSFERHYNVHNWRKSNEFGKIIEASPSVKKNINTIEEQFPCTEEMEAYLIYRFHEASFRTLWKSVRPVEIFIKENHLNLRGTLQEIKTAVHRIYENPLVRNILVVLIPKLRSPDIKKISKRISECYVSTFLLHTSDVDTKLLLCSTSSTELLEVQTFLENMVPQTHRFKIWREIKFDLTKLNALLASLKDSYVDVSVLPEEVEIRALCGKDIVSTWIDIQQCFQVFSETVVVRSEQLEKWQKNFEDKATTLSCHIVVSEMNQRKDVYEAINITGFVGENVKELVDYVTSKSAVQEKVIFKDFCAGSIMSKTQFEQWKKHGQSKNVTVSQIKEGLGFLVAGKPLEVDDVVSSILKNYDCMLESGKHISHGQLVLKSLYQPVCTCEKVSNWKNQMASKFMGECIFNFASNDHLKDNCISKAFLRVSKDHVVAICIVNNNLSVEKTDAIVLPTDRYCEGNSYPVQLPSLKVETFSCLMNETLQETGSVEMLDDEHFSCTKLIHIVYPETDLNNGGIPDFIQKSLLFAADIHFGSISFPDVNPKMISPLIDSLISLHSPTIHTVSLAVSDKNQAKCYAKVLESKVSSCLTSSVKDKETKNYLWMWKDDNGVAVAYDLVSTDLLNLSYKKDPLGICGLQIEHQYYKVDFRTMKQCNIGSQFEREVTKSLCKGITKPSITWKYLDDSGNFSAYLPKDSIQIEAMFQKRIVSSTMLDINSRKYYFDFTAMLQVNVETRYSRKINRVVPHLAGNLSKPEFLCKNEVIVNFRSPSEHFPAFKNYIHEGLNELIISDNISLPFDHLPDYIEAIINKNPMVDCEITTAGPITQGKRSFLRVRGLQEHVQKAQNELQKAIINAFSPKSLPSPQKETPYPQLWDVMSTGEDCKIVTLASTSYEYAQVFAKFTETLAQYKVLDILRVQNKCIWERYAMTKSRMTEKNCGRINELELFHGSRTAPAERICKSEEGFDMRFSREGLWGQANYFAKDSRYSDSYAYSNKGIKEMMLAQVLTGDSYECKSDRSLRMPPMKNENETDQSKVLHRYNSVCGVTCDCKVYMTYCNENAYPAYIIQYTATSSSNNTHGATSQTQHVQVKLTNTQQLHSTLPLQASSQPNSTGIGQWQSQASSQSNTATHLSQGQSVSLQQQQQQQQSSTDQVKSPTKNTGQVPVQHSARKQGNCTIS